MALHPPGAGAAMVGHRRIYAWGRRVHHLTVATSVCSVLVFLALALGFDGGAWVEVIFAPVVALALISPFWDGIALVLALSLRRRWNEVPDEATYPWWLTTRWAGIHLAVLLGFVALVWLGFLRF